MKRLRNAIMAAVTACMGFVGVAHADEMDEILKRGELRVAVQSQGAPVSFVSKKGERTGLAVELAKMMATDLGVKIVFQDYDFKGLIPALLSGKVDFIAADMTPTPQRAAQLLFSRPMFYQETVAVALKDAPYKTWEDLNKAGLNIGATQASSYGEAIKKFMPKATLKEFAGGTAAVTQALSERPSRCGGLGPRQRLELRARIRQPQDPRGHHHPRAAVLRHTGERRSPEDVARQLC